MHKVPDRDLERFGNMVNQAMAKRDSKLALTQEEVTKYICPKATETEAYIFLRFCQAQDLNPFTGDAFLVKYQDKDKAAIVIGLPAILKRASRHPQYNGYQAGVVLETKDGLLEREGSLVLKSEVLIGGWCKIYRKDWPIPLKHTVSLSEYNKNQFLWKEMPATMIEKVVIHQGLRRAFPESYESIYEDVGLQTTEDPALMPPIDSDLESRGTPASPGQPPVGQPPAETPSGTPQTEIEFRTRAWNELKISNPKALDILGVKTWAEITERYSYKEAWDKILVWARAQKEKKNGPS